MKKQWIAVLLALVTVIGVVALSSAPAQAEEEIVLLYDDRKDISALLGVTATSVQISDQNPTSYAVGTQTKDEKVLAYENGTLYAVGVGTATLTVNGTAYDVSVEEAPISLFMITGHSVGAGQYGTASQSVAVEAGQAYSSYYYKSLDTTKVDGYGIGYGSKNRVGEESSKQYSSTGILDAFAAGKGGTVGIGSAFASQWVESTGEKIWVLNAAVPGSCINEWKEGNPGHHSGTSSYAYPYYDNAVKMYQHAQKILKNEIAAGHYTLSHMGVVLFNGANFSSQYSNWTRDSILQDYHDLWDGFKAAFTMDVTGDGKTETVETLGIVPFWNASSKHYSVDKAMSYYMGASQEWPDVFVCSDVYKNWIEESGLSSFPAIDYATNDGKAVQVPESVNHIKKGGSSEWSVFCAADNTHLSQVTYNAVGFDVGTNLYKYLYENHTATGVTFMSTGGSDLSSATIKVNDRFAFAPVIAQRYGKGVTLSVEGGIELRENCIIAKEAGSAKVHALINGEIADTIAITVEPAAAHADHCACGGHASGMTNHKTCSTLTGWTAWGDSDTEKTSLPTKAGNYYLVSDITLSGAKTVSVNLNLCLNGFDIHSNNRINLKANLSITDCRTESQGWGTWKCTKSDRNLGGMFFIYEGSRVLNFYAGNFDASATAVYRGGIAHIGNGANSNATVNVYGGVFKGGNVVPKTDGTATARGGLFIVTTNSTLNIYGGELIGGSTAEYGGGICVNANTTLNISGGVIRGGEAKHGGVIYVLGTANISGGNVYGGYASSNGGNIAVAEGGELNVSGGTVSGGNSTGGGNICALPGGSVTVSKNAVIRNGWVNDGYTGNGGNLYVGVNGSKVASLNVTGGTITGGMAQKGGNIFAQDGVTISGGTVSGGKALEGGNVYASGSFSVSGGTIAGGIAQSGGNIFGKGNTTVSGGEITGGQASGCGGNIYQINDKDVTLRIAGGTISGGKTTATTSANKGGNIYIHGENDTEVGNMVMEGGIVTGGVANLGGNIYNNGTLTISDGLITLGEAKGSGACAGNLYVGMVRDTTTKEIYPTVTMEGGTISDGKSASTGGNIQCHGNFIMTGGLIAGGDGTSGGNIRLFRPGVFVLDGGSIEGGTGSGNGGVFQIVGNTATTSYSQVAALTVKSGTISGGSAKNGGTISVERFGVLNVEGGTITGGTASGNGGAIYVYSQYEGRDVVVNISGGEIINGTAAAGDGIYITCADGAKIPVLNITRDAQLSGTGTNLYVNNASDVQVNFTQLSGADTTFAVDAADKAAVFAQADADYSGYMICEGYKAVYANGKLSLTEDTSVKIAAVYEGNSLVAQYATFEEAVTAAGNGYVKLLADVQTDYVLTGSTWIDLNGFDLTGITISGTLYGMDTTTEKYDDTNIGTLTATVADGGQIVTHCKTTKEQHGDIYRYLTVAGENGTYTFHRFYVGITQLTVAPKSYGVGYKAEFYGDDTVKTVLQQTDTFGYKLWVGDNKAVVRGYDADQFGVKTTVTLRVKNFLDPAKDDVFNEARANTKVNANVFVKLASGEIIETDTVTYTFKEMIELAADRYESYSEAKQEALDTLGAEFESLMFRWAIPFVHHAAEGWTAWTNASAVPTETGKYYLDTDVSVSAVVKIAPDQEVTLCLNGHTIQGSARIYYVSGTLNICDCCHAKSETEQGAIISNSTGTMGAILYMYHGGEFNLYSGNLTATNTYSQGAIVVMGGDSGKYTNENDRIQTFNMYGGKIYGGNVTANGGNISTVRTAQINIYDGQISGGNAGEYGGNIYLKGSSTSNKTVMNIYGGTISGGTSGKNGGNIYGADTAQINIYGGIVENGTSMANGGNIAMNCDDLHIDGGLISGGSAVIGGNIFVVNNDSTDLILDGGTVTGGKAETHGGNLYFKNKGTYALNNMTISDGYAKGDGGNIYMFTDMERANYTEEEFDIIINNCTITGGKADDLGDSIYVMEADLTVSGNTVIRNENGESLYIGAGEKVMLKDLTKDAKIYVSMAVPGTLSSDTAYLSNIYSDDAAMDLQVVNGSIKLIDESIMANVPVLDGFSVGWYRGVITPGEPMPLDGMGNNAARMEKWEIKNDLEAGFTVIADETGIENAIMLVSVDTLFIQKELSDNLCLAISDATGIAKNRIFFSASHTHSGVDHDALYEQTRNYLEDFYVYMTDYAVKAVEDLAPATMQVTSIDIVAADGNSLNLSRRYIGDDGNAYSSVDSSKSYAAPAGAERESASDPEMQIIRFVRADKKDIVMTNWQSHPFGWQSGTYGRVSAENWKYFREAVQEGLEDTDCTFFLGAAGNLGHTTTALREQFESAVDSSITTAYVSGEMIDSFKANGKFMASYVIHALQTAETVNTNGLKVVNYTFEAENYYYTDEDAYKIDGAPFKAIDLDLNVITIGDSVGFVTAPYEMFHENGQQIKAYAADLGIDTCFILTNSMGENKYIASDNAFENDSTDGAYSSFGVRTGRFVQGTAEALVDQYAKMLAQLKNQDPMDSIYKTVAVNVVDQNGNAVQNVMVELIGNGNTRNCSDADGSITYYVYAGGSYSVNVVKLPAGYSYEGGLVSFENGVATVTVIAE